MVLVKQSPRILITGASGFLGWTLCAAARDSGAATLGLVRSRPLRVAGVDASECDLLDATRIAQVLREFGPDVVIHAAAEARVPRCQEDPPATERVNVGATRTLVELCGEAGVRVVFCSTDMVFSGRAAPYAACDAPEPINVYGEQKAEAERAVLRRTGNAVARLPLLFGQGPPGATDFLTGMLAALHRGDVVTLFEDEFRTPVSNHAAARGLIRLAQDKELTGIWHLGGRERLSRWEMGERVARRLNAPLALIRRGRQADVAMSAPRPPDLTLDSESALEAFWDPPATIEEQLDKCDF